MANNKRPKDIPDQMIAHRSEENPQIKYNRDRMVWVQSTVTPKKMREKNMVATFMVKKGYNDFSSQYQLCLRISQFGLTNK